MFGWPSKKPLGCDLTVSGSWPSSLEQVARFLHQTSNNIIQKGLAFVCGRRRDLNKSATNIPSQYRIVSVSPDHAMILPNDANPGRIEFSERTAEKWLTAHGER